MIVYTHRKGAVTKVSTQKISHRTRSQIVKYHLNIYTSFEIMILIQHVRHYDDMQQERGWEGKRIHCVTCSVVVIGLVNHDTIHNVSFDILEIAGKCSLAHQHTSVVARQLKPETRIFVSYNQSYLCRLILCYYF